jgi:hypothetical protein
VNPIPKDVCSRCGRTHRGEAPTCERCAKAIDAKPRTKPHAKRARSGLPNGERKG